MELPNKAKPGKGERLLLVDDDAHALESMSRRLSRRGYHVDVAEGPEAALERLANEQFDLLLLDHNMPGMTGLELLQLLRATHSETELPVLMLTAQADSQHLLKAFELGANDYLTKPVDFEVAMVRIGAQLARRDAEQALRESELRYSLAVRGTNDGLWDWDLQAGSMYFSERWKSILGYSSKEVERSPEEWFSRLHPDDAKRVRQAVRDHLQGQTAEFESEHRLLTKDNTYRWVRVRGVAVRPLDGGEPVRMAGALSDINDNKITDSLTGLANRLKFEERLAVVSERFERDSSRLFAAIYIDLDRFKLINDSMGHGAGDQLLQEAARRLTQSVRQCTVARLGGDEFAVLAEDLDSPVAAIQIAERVLDVLKQPYVIDGRDVFSAASVGVALASPGITPADLLSNADTALYKAKAKGRARLELFSENMRAEVRERMTLEVGMRRGIERGEFELFYQPKVQIGTGRIGGFEALLRWRHPEQGLLYPDSFIPLAEESGLIIPLGRFVIEQACFQLKTWQTRFGQTPNLTMAVNVSPRQMKDSGLVATVRQSLIAHGVEPSLFFLEITEGALMDETEATLAKLAELKALGVKIEIDDFGTGYSSLAYLSRFPLDGLKIDRSFVEKILSADNEKEIVRSIMGLASATGLSVVAEGIETSDHVQALMQMGCDQGQGYYFARPMEAGAITDLLLSSPQLPDLRPAP
jgi:diguanylate cyclase (GGDEF)-like protein/PAS domain S-box-containing protein